jgi:hypothetical protein
MKLRTSLDILILFPVLFTCLLQAVDLPLMSRDISLRLGPDERRAKKAPKVH